MPLTRASRKRLSAGEGADAVSNAEIHVDDPNKAAVPVSRATKRARTTKTKTTTKATAASRKSRALQPVATNEIANTNANSTQQKPAAKPRSRPPKKAKATTAAIADTSTKTKTDESAEHAHANDVVAPIAVASSATLAEDKPNNAPPTNAHSRGNHVAQAPAMARVSRIQATSSFYQNGVPDDIDERDKNDPLSVFDYVNDMYDHFFLKERRFSVQTSYMGPAFQGKQPHINETMRCILVDWLIEVHYKFKLFPETLYLTVNILDRFLSKTTEVVSKRDLQLVGVTALLISAKYEEMYVPELRDLTYICDGAYTESKILRMEENILKTLNYDVTLPTPHTFLIRYLKAAHADKLMAQLACFLLDGTLLSFENLSCRFRPSKLAAAAILLARRELGRHNWSPTLLQYSRYREEEILPVACALLQNKHRLDKNQELKALGKKYSKTKYGKVSHYQFAPLELIEDTESGDESMDGSNL